ncbi:hypothetical protein IKB17_04955 [bacterium]|nr:hypothetical protein [bacterium]
MALKGVNNNQKNVSGSKEDFKTFADRLNKTFPDRTSTVEEKERAIAAKKKIMAHPDCPADTKKVLQKEIATIEGEIQRMSSVFGKRNDLG